LAFGCLQTLTAVLLSVLSIQCLLAGLLLLSIIKQKLETTKESIIRLILLDEKTNEIAKFSFLNKDTKFSVLGEKRTKISQTADKF
jgi:hypothetical protein